MPETALLVQDLQNLIVGMVCDQSKVEPYLERVSTAIAAARKASIPVIYVVIGFRAGFPEISERNMMFSRIAQMDGVGPGSPKMEIHDAVKPRDGDIIVTKHRVGAFAGTDLEVVLRSLGVTKLVLTGLATSGIVLSTLRHAADSDYSCTVLEDLCDDRDAEVHKVLMEKVFPGQATVQSSKEWMDKIGA